MPEYRVLRIDEQLYGCEELPAGQPVVETPARIALHVGHSLHGLPSTGCSQLTERARILAIVVFPVPRVPQNRYA